VLLRLLVPGLSVLDVGSGPGGLSAEIARRVDPGLVIGLDVSAAMVALSRARYPRRKTPNLAFRRGDILRSRWMRVFDLVNAAQTLQWIPQAQVAVDRMAQAVKSGGRVVLMDVDHTRVEWSQAPVAWIRFVEAFRRWRAAAGLDNAIARRLGPMLRAAGLTDVTVIRKVRVVRSGDGDFFRMAGGWRMLAENRGRQVVTAGFCTERDRQSALKTFAGWMQEPERRQVTYETAAVGTRRG
jgi:SAM-dependent methyltransferase